MAETKNQETPAPDNDRMAVILETQRHRDEIVNFLRGKVATGLHVRTLLGLLTVICTDLTLEILDGTVGHLAAQIQPSNAAAGGTTAKAPAA